MPSNALLYCPVWFSNFSSNHILPIHSPLTSEADSKMKMTSPLANPSIHCLDFDVLWRIFAMNADMFDDPRAGEQEKKVQGDGSFGE